jgi:hypothetical protein
MNRHARQARLAGVGASGQTRIEAARGDVPLDGLAADVAARYLAGAGVRRVRVRANAVAKGARALDATLEVDVDPTLEIATDPVELDDPAARELAGGALCALRVLRAALGGAS